jgi:tRNA (adenine57-N1/adenine58-N1)-methyltransferase
MEGFILMSLINKEKRKLRTNSIEWVSLTLCIVISITHRNVLRDGFDFEESIEGTIDAVFLDLPSPEQAVVLADKVIKEYGYLCSFSPCIE